MKSIEIFTIFPELYEFSEAIQDLCLYCHNNGTSHINSLNINLIHIACILSFLYLPYLIMDNAAYALLILLKNY